MRYCLQGAALDEVLAFFPAALSSKAQDTTFDSLLTSLLTAGNAPDTGKPAQHNVAQCIAKLALTGGTSHVSGVVKGLLAQLQVSTCYGQRCMLISCPLDARYNKPCACTGRRAAASGHRKGRQGAGNALRLKR